MSTHAITKLYNTPQIAKSREQASVQVGQDPAKLWDLWVHPEKYRFKDTAESHSLDILA